MTGQAIMGFGKEYDGSCKVPDCAFWVEDADGAPQPKFALEIGLTESYEQLVRDAKLLLEGTDSISVVVLAKFTETPKYRCPIRQPTLNKLDQWNIPKECAEIRFKDFAAVKPYGPVTYKGLQWIGEISEAFLEVWKVDPTTTKAKKDGVRMVGSLGIKLTFYTNAS